jgi:type II restriction/modification system DNA methylase subunit YeeA
MNKAELKKFAVQARRDLISKVSLKAEQYGITKDKELMMEENYGQLIVNGNSYPTDMRHAFQTLQQRLKAIGYEQLIEEVAYTWFNRIIAIRYMEVNNYLPDRVSILSSNTGKNEPDILLQYETTSLDVDRQQINEWIQNGNVELAYRKLFVAQCNALHGFMPFLFEKINDNTELLLPDYLLDSESFIQKLIINEEITHSFEEVEVVGWLYQYYNSEPKDIVFSNLKRKQKIEKYDIPAATQLFTPRWIVQYMVENSLGQLWLEVNPESQIKNSMRYYIEPSKQEEKVKQKLEEIKFNNINLEEIKIIDPCVGSGHILVYVFDLLYKMYEESGYLSSAIPQLILEKNLYGLDVDARAVQLASFALLMKARKKSRRIFRKKVQLNLHAINESNEIEIEGIVKLLAQNEKEEEEIRSILITFNDAKNFGSTIIPPKINYGEYIRRMESLDEFQLNSENFLAYDQINYVQKIFKQAHMLSDTYDVVITNPPYMGSKGMNKSLVKYLKENYKDSKNDLSTVLMERSFDLLKVNGFTSMINIPSWMFLSSYNKLRENIINQSLIINLIHLGRGIFGSDFGTVTFVFRKSKIQDYKGTYKRLIDKQGEVDSLEEKEKKYFEQHRNYIKKQKGFKSIPGTPIAYWASDKVREIFAKNPKLSDIAEPKQGLATADNDRFLRQWYEISFDNISFNSHNSEEALESQRKWFPFNKGGAFRKWYGNQEYVVNWENDGSEIKNNIIKRYPYLKGKYEFVVKNEKFYFREGVTWTAISSSKLAVRFSPVGFLFSNAGMMVFSDRSINSLVLLGYLNSKLSFMFSQQLSSTINFDQGIIARLPFKKIEDYKELKILEQLVNKAINVSKSDWDSFETSWDFQKHPLLIYKEKDNFLSSSYKKWEEITIDNYCSQKNTEEKINQFFINLYHLQDELTPEVSEDDVTIRKGDRERDTKSFLSYFIGCMLGRYSLDVEGLSYAGGEYDETRYKTFKPNKNGLIQLTDDNYFDNDIIRRLREFLFVAFSPETVNENIQWLAESLTMKKNESPEERLRRYFIEEFFNDHCKIYQKRPIYWLVDSGKQKGLRTLIYMHRYQPDTMATIRFEHLQEIQSKYQNEIDMIDTRLANPSLSASDKRSLEKSKSDYQKKIEELQEFDKKLATCANEQIDIDLDAGVKENYASFGDVLSKIK